ncbi:response regulator transcription factor [Desulfobulbus oligotrophicus]|jgi:two-component system OmpR family response regulator|uniref:Response regulator n=1 Tax=Desulfobulbus oligotrophicus TaxID=1909699 RepID=A0A7T5VBU3_9BACT|nr:response regulator [Desulfobulbus oligotrophicus]MDY0390025.1 response regulator [Desulfobulbus oligotrophicus]QQG64990.1 response regulator [Desulfobulbus oligotrophicus]
MQPVRVLTIAEDEEFSDILTDRLRSWGFDATAADNRREALETVLVRPPDVVVLNLRAEHDDDLETLRLLRSRNRNIEVILLICKGATTTGIRGLELGAFDSLPQPVELGELIEKIHLACNRHISTME